MNLFRAASSRGDAVVLGGQRITLPASVLSAKPGLAAYNGRELAVGIRPEHLVDPRTADASLPRLQGEVRFTEALPPERLVYATVAAQPVLTDDVIEIAKDVDEAAVERLESLADDHFVLACSRFDIAAPEPSRGVFEFAIVADKIHFFDLGSGSAIP